MQNRLLKLLMLSVTFNIIFTPLNGSIANLFGYSMIVLFCLYPFAGYTSIQPLKMNYLVLILVILMATSCLISFSSFKTENIVNQILPALSFLSFYWSLSIKKDFYNDVLDLRYFLKLNYLLSFAYICYAFLPFDFSYIVMNAWDYEVLTLGMGNPNAAAIYVMFSIVLLCLGYIKAENSKQKVLNAVFIVLLIYILTMLRSRTVLLSTIIIVWVSVFKRNIKITRILPKLIMLVPIAMIAFQVVLTNMGADATVLGKPISTGRGAFYSDLLSEIFDFPQKFIFGEYFKYPLSNLHNSVLVILFSLGGVGYFVYHLFWVRFLAYLRGVCNTQIQKVAFVTILCLIIHSSSEAAFITGALPYGCMGLLIVEIAKGKISFIESQKGN